MQSQKIPLILLACASLAWARDFSGARALEFTRQAVEFGPRPPGSPAIGRLQTWLVGKLKTLKCEVSEDVFTARTPRGAIEMKNIIARFRGASPRAVVFTGHYDTKYMPAIRFVGADDGGSSTGFLLEMAHALDGRQLAGDVYLVWFDGEEAFGEWSATDSLYGSRHLAQRWSTEGLLGRIRALINVDMIGDRNLDIVNDENSTASLRRLIWDTAGALGAGKYFLTGPGSLLDDHIPFVQDGVTAADLIDFDYGPNNSWWHSDKDTMDKLSANSLGVVGKVVIETIRKLEP